MANRGGNLWVTWLKNDGTKITEQPDIANRLAAEISKNSSSNNYTAKFQKYQTKAKKEKVNFNSQNDEKYNLEFSVRGCITQVSRYCYWSR